VKQKFVFGFITLTIIVCTIGLEACRKNDAHLTTAVPFIIPPGFPQPEYDFAANPLNKETIELGRHLFYEGRLSLDGNFPCASCHQQIAAFTTYDHDLSHGYNHSHTKRNAPALQNLAWLKAFTQDGKELAMESVFEKHITHPEEMAETINGVITKLKNDTLYQRLFTAAYGSRHVTKDRMFTALKQFLLTFISSNSKYDEVKKGTASFTAQEASGYLIFQTKCVTCHTEPLFTDNSYRNIGLPITPFLNDYGRLSVTGNVTDSFKFRVPSLRNAAASAYYMHDGRFGTLRTTLTHYRTGIVNSTTLDPQLHGGIALTNTDVDNLVAFIRTLTDSSFLKNPALGQP
jgi:cytochrome c peroxidase